MAEHCRGGRGEGRAPLRRPGLRGSVLGGLAGNAPATPWHAESRLESQLQGGGRLRLGGSTCGPVAGPLGAGPGLAKLPSGQPWGLL